MIGAVTFTAGLAGVVIALPVGLSRLRSGNNPILPVTALTELRVIAGAAALIAVAAVLALAIGAVLRRGARARGHRRSRRDRAALPARDHSLPAAPKGRVSRTLHAEWTKLRTASGTGGLLLAVVIVTMAVGAAVAGSVTCHVADGCGQDPAKVSLVGVYLGQAVAAILAVLAIGGEYGTGIIRLTFAAMPGRLSVLAAKATVVTGLVLAGQLILPGHGLAGPPLSLANGADLRAALGSALYLALIGLLALGVAAAVRDSATAIGIVLGLLFLLPLLTTTTSTGAWRRHLEQIAPMPAGLDIQATVNLHGLPLTPWQGLGVLVAWAAGALLLGGLTLRLRDA